MFNRGMSSAIKNGLVFCFLAVFLIACTACNDNSPINTLFNRFAADETIEPTEPTGSTAAINNAGAAHNNNQAAPEPEVTLSADEALGLISQRFKYEGSGEVSQHKSEWADGVELFHFELHWYGDAITYSSILINSRTGEMEIEEIEYDYAQDMLAYWREMTWKFGYMEVIEAAHQYAHYGAWPPMHDSQYPFLLTGFMLADLNFDGTPELFIFGDGAGSSEYVRILTIGPDGVYEFFRGPCNINEIKLFRRHSDDSYAWGFISAIGSSDYYGGVIYRTDKDTVLDGGFEDNAVAHKFSSRYNHISRGEEYTLDGRTVSQQEYNRLMAEYLPGGGYSRLNPAKAAIEYDYTFFENGRLAYSYHEDDLWKFLNSYAFIPEAPSLEIVNDRFGFAIDIPADWKANAPYDDGFFIDSGLDIVDIRAYAENDVMPLDYFLRADNVWHFDEFVFDDGTIGWRILHDDDIIRFMYHSLGRYVTFYVDHAAAVPWFDDNRELVYLIARTLRDVSYG